MDLMSSAFISSSSTMPAASFTCSIGVSRAGNSPKAAAADSRIESRSNIFISKSLPRSHTIFLYECARVRSGIGLALTSLSSS